jgi:hypothetical protein
MENSFQLSFLQIFERIGKDIMTDDVPTAKGPNEPSLHRVARRVFPKEYDAFFSAEGRPEKENKTTLWRRKGIA